MQTKLRRSPLRFIRKRCREEIAEGNLRRVSKQQKELQAAELFQYSAFYPSKIRQKLKTIRNKMAMRNCSESSASPRLSGSNLLLTAPGRKRLTVDRMFKSVVKRNQQDEHESRKPSPKAENHL